MNEEQRKRAEENYRKSVRWLRRSIPPDDIYDFTEQCLASCEYLIKKICDLSDITEEVKKDKILAKWIQNVINIRKLQDNGAKGIIDVSIRFEELP